MKSFKLKNIIMVLLIGLMLGGCACTTDPLSRECFDSSVDLGYGMILDSITDSPLALF